MKGCPVRFGRHMSNTPKALRQAREIGCDAIQVFLTNPRGWAAPALDPAAATAFREAAATHDLRPVVVHAAYIINLASPKDEIFDKSVELLAATMERASAYGAESVVFHVGSHSGSGEEAGKARLAGGIRRVLERSPGDVLLLLENDTGGGGKLGYSFEHLAGVLGQLAEYESHLGVCLDTAHLWAAGFDIGTPDGVAETLAAAERILGPGRVRVIHVNDAREGMGSHRDIHARIGAGTIPRAGLEAFLRHPTLASAVAIGETPYPEVAPGQPDWEAEREHMRLARDVAGLAMPLAATSPSAESPARG